MDTFSELKLDNVMFEEDEFIRSNIIRRVMSIRADLEDGNHVLLSNMYIDIGVTLPPEDALLEYIRNPEWWSSIVMSWEDYKTLLINHNVPHWITACEELYESKQ